MKTIEDRLFRFLPGLVILLSSLLPSTSPYIGDTAGYARTVAAHRAGQPTTGFDPLWEFGHLLWRPLGAVLAPACLALVPDSRAPEDWLKVANGFLALSILAGMGVCALCFDLFRRLAGWKVAVLLTFGMAWANGVLLYTLSGSSYITGLFFSVAAMWVLSRGWNGSARQVVVGVLAGCAALFWLPYILTIPALSVCPWIWKRLPVRDGIKGALRIGIAAAVCVVIAMAVGAAKAGVRHPAQIRQWVAVDAQPNRTWIRAVSGFPRLMVDLSRDGSMMKRYAWRDPYQRIGFFELARRSLWKLAAFYGFLVAVVWMASRSERGRAALMVGMVATVPLFYFAIVLFEPSSPERFLPLLPFILVIAAASWSGNGRWIAGSFLVSLPLINGPVFIESWSHVPGMMAAQMQDVARNTAPGDLLVTVTFADPFPQWAEQRIFHPSLRRTRPLTYQVVSLGYSRTGSWREDFSRRVLDHWTTGRDVWVRRGALSERPDPMLQWVEGDDPNIRWVDIRAFLSRFAFDRTTERIDGFTRLARTGENRDVLQSFVSSGGSEHKTSVRQFSAQL